MGLDLGICPGAPGFQVTPLGRRDGSHSVWSRAPRRSPGRVQGTKFAINYVRCPQELMIVFSLNFIINITFPGIITRIDFQPIFARSDSVLTPAKKVQLTLIGSPLPLSNEPKMNIVRCL